MADYRRVEIGFAGGQVVGLRLEQARLDELRKAVERGEGWYDLETADGQVALDLSKVVFVGTATGRPGIGFTQE